MVRRLILLLAIFASAALARQRVQGNCEQGNFTVTVSGASSVEKVQRSFSACTVTVYAAGTVNISTIFADNSGTAQANPFTAATDGYWFFYADNGRYDVKLSGGGIPTPFTRGDFWIYDNTEVVFPSSTKAGLPSPGTAGRLRRVTDSVRGLWMDQGSQWFGLNGELINVREVGATGDGVTDDTTAIQGAITTLEASTHGGVIYFPPGFYKVTALTIAGSKDVWLAGAGWGTPSITAGGSTIKCVGVGDCVTVGNTVSDQTVDVRILSIRLLGQAGTLKGVVFNKVHSARVQDSKIERFGGDGIYVNQSFACWFLENYVNNNGGNGFENTQNGDLTVIRGNRFLANTLSGILMVGNAHGSLISSNDIEGNAIGIQVLLAGTSQLESLKIEANYFENQTGKNMSIAEDASAFFLDNLFVYGNEFQPGTGTAAANAVAIDRCRNPTFIGNRFNSSNFTATANTSNLTSIGNTYGGALGSTYPSGASGLLALDGNNVLIRSTTPGQFDLGVVADWVTNLWANNAARWKILDSTNTYALQGLQHPIIDILGISATTTASKNLRGQAVITDANQQTTVTLPTAEPNNSYFATCSITHKVGAGVPSGAFNCWIESKLAASFVINLVAAPGVGNSVTVDWILIR